MLRASSDLFCRKVCFAVVFFLREDDCENGVGPAAGLVHVGGSHSSGRSNKVRKQHNLLFVIEINGLGHTYGAVVTGFMCIMVKVLLCVYGVFNNLSIK